MALVPDYARIVKDVSLSSNEVDNISANRTNLFGTAPFLEDSELSEGR